MREFERLSLGATFFEFPKASGVVNIAYGLEGQYGLLRGKVEKMIMANPHVLPEFEMINNVYRNRMFPTESLIEYKSFSNSKLIDEFKKQESRDPRMGISQGYLLAATMETLIQDEVQEYLKNTRYISPFLEIPKNEDPKERLWEMVGFAERLKPIIYGTINESFLKRIKNI